MNATKQRQGADYYMQYRIANSRYMSQEERQSLINDIRDMVSPKQRLAFLHEDRLDRRGLRLLKGQMSAGNKTGKTKTQP